MAGNQILKKQGKIYKTKLISIIFIISTILLAFCYFLFLNKQVSASQKTLSKKNISKKSKKLRVNNPLSSKIICIDPGHQARANLNREPIGPGSSITKEKTKGGATGISSRVPEYKITLSISFKLKRLLENKGIKVIMTRESNNVNISNSKRAQIANKAKANLFVRIHADGNANSSINGYSVFYPEKNLWTEKIYNESKRAAQLISDKLSITGAKNNGITPRGDLAGFNWSKVPSVLVETGFLSNPTEDKLLNNDAYQEKIAQGIFNGIVEFLLKQ